MSESVFFFLTLAAGFYMAWSIGANDVANAMGTSVGSRALTLRQAVIIAAILEFSGAFFFGSHVTETVQTGIINPDFFKYNPMAFAYGMLSALIAVGLWLQLATWFGWPVSTTHAIVGALVGFGATMGGIEGVYWSHVAYIVTSWAISPIMGGVLSFLLFMLLRRAVFNRPKPLEAAKKIMPFLVFAVTVTLVLLLLFNGLQNVDLDFSLTQTLLIAIGLGFLSAAICQKMVLNISHPKNPDSITEEFNQIEKMFSYLQIISACLMAFAHGANDVANAIGPLSAAIQVSQHQAISAVTVVPIWALALGGIGIVVGLATWGWRVIETIGRKLTELTPTRGFSAEFGAALTILSASRLGLPISTTHTLVGAVVGVGLARGLGALNLAVMRDIFISWIITVPAGAILTVAIFWLFTLL
ncbi:MAG: inorganic phosphate transporter [Chlamydiia bacterium]|nr:inorganic phosphate transporter [Chlamydiia bacterium]